MAEGLIYRFVFIFNFLTVNYFSFLDLFVFCFPHFWWKEYFSRTPVSYMYTNSIELVPRFGLLPSPRCGGITKTKIPRVCSSSMLRASWCVWRSMSLLFDYMCMRLPFFLWSIAGVPSSQALPGFLITAPPPVLILAVLGALAVWIHNQKSKKTLTQGPTLAFWAKAERDKSKSWQVALVKLTCHPRLRSLFKSIDKWQLVKPTCQVNSKGGPPQITSASCPTRRTPAGE